MFKFLLLVIKNIFSLNSIKIVTQLRFCETFLKINKNKNVKFGNHQDNEVISKGNL